MTAEHGNLDTTLRRLINRWTTGFLILESDWTIVYGNPAARRMLGIETCEGSNLLHHLTEELCLPSAEVGSEDSSFTVSRKGDPEAHYSLSLSPVENPQGNGHMFVLLQEAPDQEEASQIPDDFLALISHRLLTPLAAVSANLSILRKPDLLRVPDDLEKTITGAEGAVNKVTRAINQIIALAEVRPETPGYTPASKVREILEMHAASVCLRDPNWGGALEVAVELEESGIPLSPNELDVIAENTIDNALKFCDKPEPSIRVTASRCGSLVLFTVEDNGRGIDPGDEARVFDPFFQSAPDRAGAGLGLSLVRKIVHARGGTASVRSTPGEGTTVRIEIPVQVEHSESANRRNGDGAKVPAGPSTRSATP